MIKVNYYFPSTTIKIPVNILSQGVSLGGAYALPGLTEGARRATGVSPGSQKIYPF